MNSIISFNLSALPVLFSNLNVSELKFIFVLAYYISATDKKVFINSAENREWLAAYGFRRPVNRISDLLTSLERKKMLIKEGTNTYSLNKHIMASFI
jgi:hypothetical protein